VDSVDFLRLFAEEGAHDENLVPKSSSGCAGRSACAGDYPRNSKNDRVNPMAGSGHVPDPAIKANIG
jgi:hypothetical protein